MKLMLVGGKRSREFSERVQGMFAVAANVLPGQSLEDVERMAVLGNLIERVLILEAAWTLDGISTNERDLRKRIGEMTRQARERGGYEQYVFMARSPERARLCFEETYDICDRAAVVLYQQAATVVILHELLATDILGMRPALVYNPLTTEVEEPYEVSIDVPYDTPDGSAVSAAKLKRTIKKTRGAAIQRLQGNAPWYATHQTGGIQMTEFNQQPTFPFVGAAPADYFSTVSSDRGFADETPLAPTAPIDLNPHLRHIFNGGGATPFATSVAQPSVVIPVAPQIPVSGDMATYIRSKAHRGFVLSFIGPGGSGSTFMALNCAARIYSAGFSTALIDGDLTGHSAQYLTRLGFAGDVLSAESEARTLRPGFDMYGASQFKTPDGRAWELPSAIASRYDFIVIDLPFANLEQAVRALSASTCIAVTVESSNWGIGKATLALFNAPVDIAPVIRARARLIYNRSDKLSSGLFGAPVADDTDIKRKVDEVFGARAAAFTALSVASIVGSYASAEEYWFSDKLFSDSPEGAALFDSVLYGLLT